MSQDTNVVGLLVRYAVDIASAKQTEDVTKRLKDGVKGFEAELRNLERAGANPEFLAAARASFVATQQSAEKLQDTFVSDTIAAAKFTAQLKDLTAASERLSAVKPPAGMGGAPGALNNTEFMKAQVAAAHEAALAEDQLRAAKQGEVAATQAVTNELRAQTGLAARLAEAAKVRESTEKGTMETLRIQAAIARNSSGLNAGAFLPGAPGGGGAGSAGDRGGLGRSITYAGRQLFMLPDVGPSTTISRGLILAGNAVEKVGGSLLQVGAAAGIAGLAIVALGVVFSAFQEMIKRQKEILNGALAAQANYYEALGEMTSEQVNQRVQELKDVRPMLVQQINETQAALEIGFATARDAAGDAVARIGDALNFSGSTELRKRLDELNAAYQESIQSEQRYTDGLEAGNFARQDAAARQQALNEDLDRYWTSVANAEMQANRLNAEGREDRMQEITRELEMYAGLGQITEQQQRQIEDLHAEYRVLERTQDSYADQLDRERVAKERILAIANQLVEFDALDKAAREDLIAQKRREIELNNVAISQPDPNTAESERRRRIIEQAGLDPSLLEDDQGGRGAQAARDELIARNALLENEIIMLTELTSTTGDLNTAEQLRLQLGKDQLSLAENANAFLERAMNMTKEQRDKENESIQFQIDNLRELAINGDLTAEAHAAVTDQMIDLQYQQKILTAITDSYADALAREEAAKQHLEDQGEELMEAYKREGEARDKLIELEREYTLAQQEHEQKLSEIEEEKQSRIQEITDKQLKDETKLREKSAKDLGEALAKIQKDSDDRIKDIRERASRTVEQAIAHGDQAAAIEALEQAAYEIKKEKEQRIEAEEEKKKEIGEQLEEQLGVLKERYEEQLKAAEKAAQDAIRAEQRRWDQEKAQRDRAIQEARVALENQQRAVKSIEDNYRRLQLEATQMHNAAMLGTMSGGLSDARGAIIQWLNDIYHDIVSMPTGGGGSSSLYQYPNSYGNQPDYGGMSQQEYERQQAINEAYAAYYRAQGVTNSFQARIIGGGGFDDGGINMRPGFFWSGVPEMHIPLTDKHNLPDMGSRSVSLYVNGRDYDEEKLARLVKQYVEQESPVIAHDVSTNMARIWEEERRPLLGAGLVWRPRR